jgi:hypothetical protein
MNLTVFVNRIKICKLSCKTLKEGQKDSNKLPRSREGLLMNKDEMQMSKEEKLMSKNN